MKRAYYPFIFILYLHFTTTYNMESDCKKRLTCIATQFPLRYFDENPPTVKKNVYIIEPEDEIKYAAYVAEHRKEIEQSISELCKRCTESMFFNNYGWRFPKNRLGMQLIDPDLYTMVENPQTFCLFDPMGSKTEGTTENV